MKPTALLLGTLLLAPFLRAQVSENFIFEEVDGVVAVEAEHFFKQTAGEVRKWHLTTMADTPAIEPDGDPNHATESSRNAYLEALPDTRRSHRDKLKSGENFFNQPGKAGILHYKVHFNNPGRYYVWARIYSTNTEDNGMHVGINGTWPATGQRMQWTRKHGWTWGSKQRTETEHGGVPHILYLDIEKPGIHTIMFSMREDGTEFDKWMMTKGKLNNVEGQGPEPKLKSGTLSEALPSVPAPVARKPASMRKSETGLMMANDFTIEKDAYLDKGKWLAVDPNQAKTGVASIVFPYRDGEYDVTLEMVGENDGQSTFEVMIEQLSLGVLTAPQTDEVFAVGPKFNKGWKKIKIHDGDIIRVKATAHSADGKEWSRARWAAIRFSPVDGKAPLDNVDIAESAKPEQPFEPLFGPRQPDGDGSVNLDGELKEWHNVVLTLDGPFAHEKDNKPNPFVDRQMNVTFTHISGEPSYKVPGYFAADGIAAESSAESGTKWRAHLAPDKAGEWTYTIEFKETNHDGKTGSFSIVQTDKKGKDFRAHGRLQYVGKRYLQFAGSGDYFLKAGADAPETLLAYADFDNTVGHKVEKSPIKTWAPHVRDWKGGDPTWKGGKGKGLIGAVNYLAEKGVNVFSFLTYNAGGDGDNVWPHLSRDDKLHFDCSKLDQWGILFNHATAKGVYLHFKLQETENDDLVTKGKGHGKQHALDRGDLGLQRKTYLRELISRFGHNLALNWNIGEENTQSEKQVEDMIRFIRETDPYQHNVVLHTYPPEQGKKYKPLLGKKDMLLGVSIQNGNVSNTHRDVLHWVTESEKSGHPWVVAMDEAGNAGTGSPPDPDWPGMKEARARLAKLGNKKKKLKVPTIDEIRAEVLWGSLMAGGTGVEYYFGYQLPENDLDAENWRSREKTWDYSRIALQFFRKHLPFIDMQNSNVLVDNAQNNNERYCFAKPGDLYVVYFRKTEAKAELDLSAADGTFSVKWFNPRSGGELQDGSVKIVNGGGKVELGAPPADASADWLVLVKKP